MDPETEDIETTGKNRAGLDENDLSAYIEPEAGGTGDLLEIFRRKSLMIFMITVIAIVFAVSATYALPQVYTATSVVQIMPDEIDVGNERLPIQITGNLKDAPLTVGGMTAKTLSSREMAIAILKGAELPEHRMTLRRRITRFVKVTIAKTWLILRYGKIKKLSPGEAAIQDVQSTISANPIKDTFMIEIIVRSEDPDKSAIIANRAAKLYVERRREEKLADSAKVIAAIEVEVTKAEEGLKTAEKQLGDYQIQEGLLSLDSDSVNKIQAMSSLDIMAKQNTRSRVTNPTVEEYRRRAGDLPVIAVRLDELRNEIDRRQKKYDQVSDQLNRVRLQAARSLPNEKVIDKAVPPLYQSKPIKLFYGLAAAFIGLLVGMTLAYIAEKRAAIFNEE